MRRLMAVLTLAALILVGTACEPPLTGYPSPARVGTPAGWTPTRVHQGDLDVTVPGTVVQDIEVRGSINIKADDVVVRRVRVRGRVWTQHSGRQYRVVVEDSVLGDTTDAASRLTSDGTIGPGRYTIRRSELYGTDGFRISRPSGGGANDVLIEDNFFRANTPPCSGYHRDGLQGYGSGRNVVVRHNTIEVRGTCDVTASVFFADGSESASVTDNLLIGGGYTLRVHDDFTPDRGPWVVTGNRIVPGSHGPALTTNTQCGASTMRWSDNARVTIDQNYDVTSVGAAVPC